MCATSVCNCELTTTTSATGNELVSPPVHPAHIPKIPCLKPDSLGKITAKQKELLDSFYNLVARATSNDRVRTLISSSQPAHATAVLAVCFVCSSLIPSQTTSPKPYSGFTSLLYLSSFSLHMGSQFWMTFVSGLTLYFSLSRHAFGDVQRVLFPRYFTFNSVLSGINLLTFSKLHCHIDWQLSHWVQLSMIATSFLAEILARLYVAPQVVKLMLSKRIIEEAEPGVGTEIGCHKPGRLQFCPHYMTIHSNFRRMHSAMACANILSMICTVVQLIYIAQSFSIVPL